MNGYLIIIKVLLGGGGCGMWIVRFESEVKEVYECVKLEVKVVFGNDEVYVEKLIENLKYIEVQVIGDKQGNVVYFFERDCFV